ncbi:unnamed protein product [Linum trigynum]|uniref:Uncharacterized protein n=1 Tax=Linum trigynum TaxID=586398 RepID=A0AAV2EB77_9ROSI
METDDEMLGRVTKSRKGGGSPPPFNFRVRELGATAIRREVDWIWWRRRETHDGMERELHYKLQSYKKWPRLARWGEWAEWRRAGLCPGELCLWVYF